MMLPYVPGPSIEAQAIKAEVCFVPSKHALFEHMVAELVSNPPCITAQPLLFRPAGTPGPTTTRPLSFWVYFARVVHTSCS
jgi:hypothetical protein